jgi:hypothetical protein
VKMTKPGHRPITLPRDKGGGGYPVGLSEPGSDVHVELEDEPGTVIEQHVLARTA